MTAAINANSSPPVASGPTSVSLGLRRRSVGDPDVLAAVCESHDGCAVVVARVEPGQSFAGMAFTERDAEESMRRGLAGRRIGRVRVVESRTFARLSDPECAEFIAGHNASRVVRVLPTGACIARPITVPGVSADSALDADAEAGLTMALELAAEAELPNVPAWRRCAGWVHRLHEPHAPGAVLTAWPAASAVSDWRAPAPERFVAPPAALFGLAMLNPRIAMATVADRANSAVSIFAPGPDRTVVRASRAPASDDSAWRAGIRTMADESARTAGWHFDAGQFGDGESGLTLWTVDAANDQSARLVVSGVRLPTGVALCLGALAVATSDRPTIASLSGLSREEVRPEVPAWQRGVSWLSRPRNAGLLIAACVLLALGVPLASALARESMLRHRAKAVDLDRRLGESERRIGFYSLLRERRWPMVKLMADIAGAAPVGVEIDLLDLNQGEPVMLRGRAERPELVAAFRENLTKSRVFTQVTTPSVEADASGVKFQLVARVEGNRAFYPGERAEDFATEPLAVRLYGPEAASADWGSATPAGNGDRSRGAPRASTPTRDRATGGTSGASGTTPSATAPAPRPAAPDRPPPPPLTDAELAAMDATQAMLEWSSRRAAASRATDEETKRRLTEESDRARQRMLEARQAGGGQQPAGGGS
ncbi:MAG: PilN domain-containing protein [Phycisphaeraceae bacterium]|nr:PilN domain-containing protein [Phycisphaeraceae bacterium]